MAAIGGTKADKADPTLAAGLLCAPALFTEAHPRPRLMPLVAKRRPINPASAAGETLALPRPVAVVQLDDYLTFVGASYYSTPEAGRSNASWALLRRTALGALTSPVREPSVIDKWAPLEVAKFEAALCMTGKHFNVISKLIGTKSTRECVEFYYTWKMSKNYKAFKATGVFEGIPDA